MTKPIHDIECLPRGRCFCMNAAPSLRLATTTHAEPPNTAHPTARQGSDPHDRNEGDI